MSKVIKYKISRSIIRTVDVPIGESQENGEVQFETKTFTEDVFTTVTLPWSEKNEKIASKEAYNGEYTIEDDGKQKPVTEQIAELKRQLSATDYKVIKCSECQLLGQEMPYDVVELHAERQAIRDEINRLEELE